ncbi:Hydrogen cyanide synthase subunit HcnC precursor [Anatilimnocola aggregata]|uniref:Hydrogen cyanide synthase subunit HcnC n=1 Tax=Anatilimnocola aggregata TaxID=2528021 RepID=A0A517Y679_9BACT|nr:glycine oxidase ThiO [Anatilimnocola aggregata]QDU25735.1 Hydrogen cyanide synthase subunit HcnC precursor [Anatilimnocola aggregata]
MKTDCLIVGGGVIGLSLAWQLALRGRKVRIIDRQAPAREASWAGAGILPPASRTALAHPLDQLRGWSYELHAEWAITLRQQTGIDTGYRQCGGLYVARAAGEAAALSAWAATQREEEVTVTQLSLDELARLEPELAKSNPPALPIRTAWLLPAECQLRNPHYLQALLKVCEQQGVEIVADCEVQDFVIENSRLQAIVTSQGSISAEQVCVTSGAWTGQLLQKLGLKIGVVPIRGQMVLFRCAHSPLRTIVNEGPRYLVPRNDGRLLVGSTEEEAGFDKRTTPEAIAELISLARTWLPSLANAEVEQTWAGLRPASFDGFPYLGAIPGVANAFVAAGHYRSGLYLSPGTAIVMAQLMCKEACSINLSPFSVGR